MFGSGPGFGLNVGNIQAMLKIAGIPTNAGSYANLGAYITANGAPIAGCSYWDVSLSTERVYGGDGNWHNVALNT